MQQKLLKSLKKNMVFENRAYEVKFTEQCIEEMTKIYDYISILLKENDAAKRLITKVNESVLELEKSPELYVKIEKVDRLKYDYHSSSKKYVVLYTVDYEKRKVIISRMIFWRNNYLL